MWPREIGCRFAVDIITSIILNFESNFTICFTKGLIHNKSAAGAKPVYETMMA